MTIFIILATMFLLCSVAAFFFKTLEIIFKSLNYLIKFLDWFVEMAGRFAFLEMDMTKEHICYARRLGLYFGFLESQKIRLYKKLAYTNRFY